MKLEQGTIFGCFSGLFLLHSPEKQITKDYARSCRSPRSTWVAQPPLGVPHQPLDQRPCGAVRDLHRLQAVVDHGHEGRGRRPSANGTSSDRSWGGSGPVFSSPPPPCHHLIGSQLQGCKKWRTRPKQGSKKVVCRGPLRHTMTDAPHRVHHISFICHGLSQNLFPPPRIATYCTAGAYHLSMWPLVRYCCLF